eukprot:5801673-Amphidinium_carterae.1
MHPLNYKELGCCPGMHKDRGCCNDIKLCQERIDVLEYCQKHGILVQVSLDTRSLNCAADITHPSADTRRRTDQYLPGRWKIPLSCHEVAADHPKRTAAQVASLAPFITSYRCNGLLSRA